MQRLLTLDGSGFGHGYGFGDGYGYSNGAGSLHESFKQLLRDQQHPLRPGYGNCFGDGYGNCFGDGYGNCDGGG